MVIVVCFYVGSREELGSAEVYKHVVYVNVVLVVYPVGHNRDFGVAVLGKLTYDGAVRKVKLTVALNAERLYVVWIAGRSVNESNEFFRSRHRIAFHLDVEADKHILVSVAVVVAESLCGYVVFFVLFVLRGGITEVKRGFRRLRLR